MNKYKDIINDINIRLEELSAYTPSSYQILCEAERYSLLSGGKRLRALIMIQTAMLGNVPPEKVLDFACAIEMVHTYSLVHDDMPELDNDDLRRGKPTCHKKFGADIALLAGDALLTKAFSVIANNSDFSSDKKIECIRILSSACGEHGMLAGQTIDKLSENNIIEYEKLLELHARKTGDMFLASTRMGAVLGDLRGDITGFLDKYISLLGIAFQIKDDILDVTSTEDVLGKPVNSDISSSKSTFVSMFGVEKSKQMLDEKISQAKSIANELKNPFFYELADYFANRAM